MYKVNFFLFLSVILTFISTSAFADYNCQVTVTLQDSHMSDINESLFRDVDWHYDVPGFRASGVSRVGDDSYGYADPFGDATMGMLFPSRAQNCINKALDKVFPDENAAISILEDIFAKTGNVNAKGMFCTQPEMWPAPGYGYVNGDYPGAENYLAKGIRFKFKARKIMNRKKWIERSAWIVIPKSYCASYYPDPPCSPDIPEPEHENDSYTAQDAAEDTEGLQEGSSSTPSWTVSYSEVHYCASKPFIPVDENEGKTHFLPAPQYPVDMNGDGLSDIILRWQNPQKGLVLRTLFAKGDGHFKESEFTAGDGSDASKLPALIGYFNHDKNTDILLRWRHEQNGLMLRTKFSHGDGSYGNMDFKSGDGPAVDAFPALIGDVDGDGLSDIILRYQHPNEGLHIRVKFANGDGTFRSTDFKAGDGPDSALHTHAMDVNGDKKTDIVYIFQDGSGLHIRTRISHGDGTFSYKHFTPGGWINVDNIQSFAGDFDRDRKSDLAIVSRDDTSHALNVKVFFSQGDGTYSRKIFPLNLGISADKFRALALDINGDRRTDLAFRVRDKAQGLKIISFLSNGNGTFVRKEFVAGDGNSGDTYDALVGNYDRGRRTDITMRSRDPQAGLIIRTRLAKPSADFITVSQTLGDGSAVDGLPALTGPVFWNGGATFSRCGGACSPDVTSNTTQIKNNPPPVKIRPVQKKIIHQTK